MTDGAVPQSLLRTSPHRSSSLLTRTSIREANSHLQMLYTRNQELEQLIDEQHEDMRRKDLEYERLSKTNQLLERHCQQLQALLDDRSQRLYIFERKEVLFREAIELKPAVSSLLHVLSTVEQVDSTPVSIPINTKPLEFVQPPNRKYDRDAAQRLDAL